MRDVLEAIDDDLKAKQAQAERNRANFPEIAAIVDQVRAAGGTARLVWAANQQGHRIGNVPDGWDAVFGEGGS